MDVVRHSRPLPGILGIPVHVIGMSFGMIAKLLGVAGNILSMFGRRFLPRRIQRMLGGIRRALLPRVGPADPTAAAADFIQGFSAAYGERCPRWQISSWEMAAQKAQADGLFLFVYLHSPRHQDSAAFCRNTLCSPAFVDYLNSTFVSWGGDIRSPDAFRLASSLRVSKYPYCALLAFSGARTRLITFAEGNVRPEALAELLQAALVEHNGILWEERLIHEQRSQDRRLREEQDVEYQRSLEADRAKELERQRQEEEQRRLEDERLEKERIERERKEKEERERQMVLDLLQKRRDEKSKMLPDEPGADEEGIAVVRVRFPSGEHQQRRFRVTESLSSVIDWAESLDCNTYLKFSIATTYPRQVLVADQYSETLEALNFGKQIALAIQPEDY